VRDVLGLPEGAEPRVTVVRYQPEASVTLRLEAGLETGPSVFAKHLADGTVADIAARHQALWSTSDPARGLRIAEPLAVDPVRRVLWTRGVAGRPLTETVRPDGLPEATAPLGPLLAALHATSVATTSSIGVDGLLVEAHKKADKLARAHPPIAPLVIGLVAAATTRRRDVVRERGCTLHGDFHLDQLVSSAAGPVLVDLDSLLVGPPGSTWPSSSSTWRCETFPALSRTRSPGRCCRRTPHPPGPTSMPPCCPSVPMPSS
jgi:hypothetical protein